MSLKDELQSIISGIGQISKGNLIEAAAYELRKSKAASTNAQAVEFFKNEEAAGLIDWANKNNLWVHPVDESRFLARGFEQRVYLAEDVRYVIKLNDAVFYEYWLDYFYNLLIHNFLFPLTSYELIGFYMEGKILHAVVKQPFIEISGPTDTESVKEFLEANGFKLKKNNDYFNSELGIILEDLHDENVLTNKGVLFFIDTIFYLMPSFFDQAK